MDVGQVEPSGVDHGAGRPQRAYVRKLPEPSHKADKADFALTGPEGRNCLAEVEALTRAIQRQDDGREERVRRVREKLQNRELEDYDVYRAVAEAILDL